MPDFNNGITFINTKGEAVDIETQINGINQEIETQINSINQKIETQVDSINQEMENIMDTAYSPSNKIQYQDNFIHYEYCDLTPLITADGAEEGEVWHVEILARGNTAIAKQITFKDYTPEEAQATDETCYLKAILRKFEQRNISTSVPNIINSYTDWIPVFTISNKSTNLTVELLNAIFEDIKKGCSGAWATTVFTQISGNQFQVQVMCAGVTALVSKPTAWFEVSLATRFTLGPTDGWGSSSGENRVWSPLWTGPTN